MPLSDLSAGFSSVRGVAVLTSSRLLQDLTLGKASDNIAIGCTVDVPYQPLAMPSPNVFDGSSPTSATIAITSPPQQRHSRC